MSAQGKDEDPDPGRPKRRLARLRAAAARTDSRPAAVAAARWLRQRLPGDDRFGDPLSTAGRTPVEVVGRGVTAFQPERPSAAHELGLGALQVWQEVSEASGRGRGTEEVTLLFNDLVGFSAWALDAGDETAVELLRRVGAVTGSSVGAHGGEVVKRLGDGVMAVFPTPDAAVSAGLDSAEGVAGVRVAGYRPRLRCGVHTGRPRRLGGDYLGVDVNVAARVVAAAGPDEVLVSAPTCQGLEGDSFVVGPARPLVAPGAPAELRVHPVTRG